MKKLLIVRHAKSSWKNESLDDFDRPLNKRGKRDAPFMGKLMKKEGFMPDLMVSSPANRAFTTAKVFANELSYPQDEILKTQDLYLAYRDELVQITRQIDNKFNLVMLFGHNPGLTDFSNFISDYYTDNIPTTGIIGVELKEDDWRSINEDSCRFLFFEYPKKHFG